MNTVNLTGRLTHEVEIKETSTRKHVVDFQIAIRETKDDAIFIRCQAWEQNADYLGQYSTRGSLLAITSEIPVKSNLNRFIDFLKPKFIDETSDGLFPMILM